MKSRVLENFSPTHDSSPGEKLLRLQQEDTAVKYCRDFIGLASNAPEIPEQVLGLAFMNRVKPKTRAGVRMFEPKNLKKMMNAAKMVEDWAEQGEHISGNHAGGGEGFHRYLSEKVISCGLRGNPAGADPSNHKSNLPNSPRTSSYGTMGNKSLNPQNRSNANRGSPYRKLLKQRSERRKPKGFVSNAMADIMSAINADIRNFTSLL